MCQHQAGGLQAGRLHIHTPQAQDLLVIAHEVCGHEGQHLLVRHQPLLHLLRTQLLLARAARVHKARVHGVELVAGSCNEQLAACDAVLCGGHRDGLGRQPGEVGLTQHLQGGRGEGGEGLRAVWVEQVVQHTELPLRGVVQLHGGHAHPVCGLVPEVKHHQILRKQRVHWARGPQVGLAVQDATRHGVQQVGSEAGVVGAAGGALIPLLLLPLLVIVIVAARLA
mmetsp:Transcript_23118/g.50727  ORF Transcript_23118/g.50727 Transcript_23118/m.50727 type:complete len:225 (-) Transcript_23118:902-1576(-)